VGGPLAAGLLTGVGGGIVIVRLLRSELYGVTPGALSPFLYAVAACIAVALLAPAYPLWRVTRVRVVDALRAS
jgi:ABC-type antimicrobial peptide transport system permease subunit